MSSGHRWDLPGVPRKGFGGWNLRNPFVFLGGGKRIASIDDRREASSFFTEPTPQASAAAPVRRSNRRQLRFPENLGRNGIKWRSIVVSAGSFAEASARRLFLDEARRRVLALLEDLHWFGTQHGRRPPPWCWERLAAIADQVGADDAPSSVLEDTITTVEKEIHNALAELDLDRPIAYTVVAEPLPAPRPLRPFLTVLRGGRVD